MGRYQFPAEELNNLEQMPVSLAVYQFVDGHIYVLALSDGYCEMFELPDRQEAYRLLNRDVLSNTHPDDIPRIKEAIRCFIAESGRYEAIFRARKYREQDCHIIHAVGKHIYTDDGVRLAYVWFTDEGAYTEEDDTETTALNRTFNNALHEESILRASYYDGLTGLPNMPHFFTLAEAGKEAAVESGGRAVLLYIDLNGMKSYNDRCGFAEGDRLLREFAALLERTFGKESCCRIGGDRFAVHTVEDGLEDILRRLFLDAKAINGGNSLPVRAGIYSTGIEDIPVSSAFDRAKIACDAIPKTDISGFNWYSDEMRRAIKRRQYILSHIDQAIQEKWIEVYYQPIIRSVNGKVCDEEALARWIDPVEGFMSPADFIPTLEDAGLIYKLDLYVLERVLDKMRRQAAAGLYIVPHSINLSRADFDACDIVEEICKRVDASAIGRNNITIEITESVIGSDFKFMKAQVERFRSLGFPVWMDDFGTGYSSLDVLQSIKFDLIKFDMSFMRKLDEGDSGRIILTEMMKMAASLGVDTVCEGVETENQVGFLREIGCSKLQGFYFCKPIPIEQIIERNRKGAWIGYENPEEADYYESISRVNLFDLGVISSEDESAFQTPFNTLPIGILEITGDRVRYVRSNQPYRDFVKRYCGFDAANECVEFNSAMSGTDSSFMANVKQCCENGSRAFFDEAMPDGSRVHTFVRRIGVSPVNGSVAVAIAVLSISEPDESESYADIARALAADYYIIYVVDLDTERFIEYTSPVGGEELAFERHGEDFFAALRRDASTRIYEEEREPLMKWFTRENIIRELDVQGVFTTSFRVIDTGTPMYVNIKITRMQGRNRIIVGVSVIDAQMKQQEEEEKLRRERILLSRVAALSPDYIVLYTIDPATGRYTQYNPSNEYESVGLARQGEDFFADVIQDSPRAIAPEDLERHLQVLTKENVMREIQKNGVLIYDYRMLMEGKSVPVSLRATLIEEDDGEKILLGIMSDETEENRRRLEEERTIYARLHALTGNFIVVYVVDPETNHYREFSATDDYVDSFAQAKTGEDFFDKVREVARTFNAPEDMDRFLSVFTKENILAEIGRSGIFTLVYRLMMDGKPLYVKMNAAMVEEKEGPRLIVGLNNIDAQYRQRENDREIARQKEIYDQITASLAEQYDTLYFIDIATSTYVEISATDEYKKLNVPATGNDFFAESRRSIRKFVHPEDQEKAIRLHYKDVMLNNLRDLSSFSMAWRLVVNGRVSHIRHTEIMAKDGKHIIVCIKNIDAEIQAKLAQMEDQKKNVTFTQIAERLADHYDFIYYIDCQNSNYTELSAKKKSGELKVQEEGKDFFTTAWNNAGRLVHSEDRERIRLFLNRDNLITRLESRRHLTEDYRMVIDAETTQYTRMSVTYSSDHSHFIICVENRDEDVRREKEQLAALSMANELARRDELTHTKNKTAYHEMEKELQRQIEEGGDPFGIVVCDINGLKAVNDTEGHKAGDDYIKASCMLVCRIFHHSPVFRIGGDEFVVVLRGQDFGNRASLLSSLRRQVEENTRIGEGPIVASGLAEFQPFVDRTVEDVFNRADNQMYSDKTRLKEQKLLQESRSLKQKANVQIITEDRRTMLDTLFKAFEVVSEGTYVYLCDMKYDFSRWSKNAVDTYGLPSEYMYGAGDIWENQIHPEDREAYHKGIDEIFSGNAAGHDMQYRARRVTGEYDVCTCRGVVIRDPAGQPDYFAGTIRNHGIQGHIDTLTGLRNQYGFFEDLDICIRRNAEISAALFGISRFSEINEMYGYHFGNRVLQLYAREVFERTGNTGHTYRIDGTKFAVISNTLSIAEMRENYNRFRAFLHEEFKADDRHIMLDLHCGALRVDHFDIDSQTVYACLNYADEESKLRQQGDMVEFRDDLNEGSHQRLEKLHAIRASIMHGYEGFYLLYQPVVDAETERLIGAEALLRWKNDRYGMVPPDQFIPILESDPLFPELGEWIIRESVLAAKEMLKYNPGFIINVNLSYTQLEKPDFADMVLRILNELEYPPEHLCFEVTERCRLLDLELLKNVVVSLKANGILVALDDFGTGFSAIGILREIPVNIIKIDRSFVRMIEENDIDRKIVGSIADLASIFGAKVCVEGIETSGMRDILKNYHVESFQGYYYAKPLLLEQFMKWKKEGPEE